MEGGIVAGAAMQKKNGAHIERNRGIISGMAWTTEAGAFRRSEAALNLSASRSAAGMRDIEHYAQNMYAHILSA